MITKKRFSFFSFFSIMIIQSSSKEFGWAEKDFNTDFIEGEQQQIRVNSSKFSWFQSNFSKRRQMNCLHSVSALQRRAALNLQYSIEQYSTVQYGAA